MSLFFAVVGSITIGIHFIDEDYVFRPHQEERFQPSGRYVLTAAPVAGQIASEGLQPSEAVIDVFIAILAGVLSQNVFNG